MTDPQQPPKNQAFRYQQEIGTGDQKGRTMIPPQIIHNDLPQLDDETLCSIAEVVATMGEQSDSEEESVTWIAILHALEIERYSRGL